MTRWMPLVFLTTMLTGCGMSQRGQEMRQEAYSRMDQVNAGMLHEQSMTAFETGQLDKALDLADQAVQRFPKGPANHVIRGRVLMEIDRLAEAERSFREAIDLDEDPDEAHYFLGIVYERLSRDDLAYEQFRIAADLQPSRLQYVMAAIESLMVQGRLTAAESVLDERFGNFEHTSALHHLRGQLKVMQGRITEASEAYEMASLLAPDDSDLVEEWARIRHAEGDHGGVLACIDELRQLHGQTPKLDLRILEARSLIETGRRPEARRAYVSLVSDYPDQLRLWQEFGLFAWDLQDWRSLERCGQRLHDAGDRSAVSRCFRAVTAREKGDLTAARALLERVLQDEPDNAMAGTLLAGICLRQGDANAAKKAWRVAVKSDPSTADDSPVTGLLGQVP